MKSDTARAYPDDLAARVRASWPPEGQPLPACLERVLDVAYHASFLRDEERPVTFRIMVCSPSLLPTDAGPPDGLLPLHFDPPRGFDEHELRRLSPAAKYHRALVGIEPRGDDIVTWGIIQSGPRWMQNAHGGRQTEPPVPPCLLVRAVRPGYLAVSCGSRLVAELRGGRLTDFTLDVFASRWLPALFASSRFEIADIHESKGGGVPREKTGEITKKLAQQMVKRIISTMRAAHHGGTVLIMPPDCNAERFLSTKYAFADERGRRQFRRLVLALLDLRTRPMENERDRARTASDLEEGLFELGHLIAALADVDGAVVLTKRFEILGFGAEIAGDLPAVDHVQRALDLEGERRVPERVDGVGTRHRSAYRLCKAVPEALAVVVSQDGGARFVTELRDDVTYWDHGLGDE